MSSYKIRDKVHRPTRRLHNEQTVSSRLERCMEYRFTYVNKMLPSMSSTHSTSVSGRLAGGSTHADALWDRRDGVHSRVAPGVVVVSPQSQDTQLVLLGEIGGVVSALIVCQRKRRVERELHLDHVLHLRGQICQPVQATRGDFDSTF